MSDLAGLQREALAMLLEFDRICRHHGIAYQLAAGSLLGAARHGGFVPWDDDIDVCLRRAAYERFLAVAPAELSPSYRLLHNGTEPGCGFLYCKIVSRGEGEANSPAFVDVFPFDGVESGRFLAGLQMWTAFILMQMLFLRQIVPAPASPAPWRMRRLVRRALTWIVARQDPHRLARWLERVARWHEGRPTGHIACLVSGRLRYCQIRAERDFDDCIEAAFEGHDFPVPRRFDTVLRRLYGDWRVPLPVEKRQPHHQIVKSDPP
ncbi:phosphorylcholine transferase LicD [Ancylobacter sp. FA202]|uniref:LicD family protein n=1 Tax=Ancylobacter sp. FA202 TaxID=1111106 RepID=UPI00037A7F60|nr:LicD family protein [Ancylobacter sp. FA202]